MGVGAYDDLAYARRFIADTGVTFTMLWSESLDAWRHYGVHSNSYFWLLDSSGARVGDGPRPYDGALAEELLDGLLDSPAA